MFDQIAVVSSEKDAVELVILISGEHLSEETIETVVTLLTNERDKDANTQLSEVE